MNTQPNPINETCPTYFLYIEAVKFCQMAMEAVLAIWSSQERVSNVSFSYHVIKSLICHVRWRGIKALGNRNPLQYQLELMKNNIHSSFISNMVCLHLMATWIWYVLIIKLRRYQYWMFYLFHIYNDLFPLYICIVVLFVLVCESTRQPALIS